MPESTRLAPADGFTIQRPDAPFDAILLLSFGGPEGPDDVIPFLENVLRGRPVPRERLLAVARHYDRFGGISPINRQNRELMQALRRELDAKGINLPLYFGNRNWHPLVTDTMKEMAEAGVRKVLTFVTSAFSSYSGCRQYRENIHDAQAALGDRAPEVFLTRKFYNHPGWISTQADRMQTALESFDAGEASAVHVVHVAHSIPVAMAEGCHYRQQLHESARLIHDRLTGDLPWSLAYQSRSGPPQQPWTGPDINDHLRDLSARGVQQVLVVPLGFISDHMEVIYDLDHEAMESAREAGLTMVRCPSAGTHPEFVSMIRALIQERLDPACSDRPFAGACGPSWDSCPVNCCLPGTGRPSPWDPPASTAAGRPGGGGERRPERS